ncbi:DUF6498-containing protein [Halorubrum aethiopicum]|uniref:DUF6498-containing protein n=1 Tax=Halorubrum aethiopicum TaxID=1758255 RepID=UPI00082A276C|nr:DUF6498-containing protein [Halorubrum aethiopicum]
MPESVEGTSSDAFGVARDDLSVLVTHLFLVVGIVFFRWNLGEIVLVYLVDVAVTLVLFGTAALFAARPIEDGEAEKWREEPTPIEIAPFLPPLYGRNVRLVASELFRGGFFLCFFAAIALSLFDWTLSSLRSTSIGVTVLAVCGSQLARVWRQCIAGESYRDRSPADAIGLALRPIGRLIVIALYVVAPVTAALGVTLILLLDVESTAALPYGDTIVLLAYVVPVGAASVWLRNDRFEVGLQYKS